MISKATGFAIYPVFSNPPTSKRRAGGSRPRSDRESGLGRPRHLRSRVFALNATDGKPRDVIQTVPVSVISSVAPTVAFSAKTRDRNDGTT